jgi:hypothetical protein
MNGPPHAEPAPEPARESETFVIANLPDPMSLTSCRACGAAVPANSQVCPSCGATMAPVPYAVYRPPPPRPPEPERPWWKTLGNVVGWAFILGVLALVVVAFVRGSAAAGQRKVEQAEMAREEPHVLTVFGMMQDTLPNAPSLDTTPRPLPTTDRAKRVWVISRMLVERWAWERQVMERHGVTRHTVPATMETARYQANARDFPEVEKYLEGRVAAIEEIDKTSAAWVEARTAALARESGIPAGEIRALFPPDFGGQARDHARYMNALLAIHRHWVRVDPRVRPAGGDMLSWQSEDEMRRANELATETRAAAASSAQARASRLEEERAAIARVIGDG